MEGKGFGKLAGRLFISLIGILFILWAIASLSLGFIGKEATAVVTNIRREGGERNEGIGGRYTYNISYPFTLPNGKKVNGLTKKIGSAVYLKADGTSTIAVRYLGIFPYINHTAGKSRLNAGQIIMMAVGLFLVIIVNRAPKRRTKQKKERAL